MKYEGELVGTVVRHKLLGKCIVLKTPQPTTHNKNPLWEVRMKNGNISGVFPQELEKIDNRQELLRKWALGAKELANIAIKEANQLDNNSDK